eukprot:TRINITY_DN7244_c0_g2_i2.p1 TRINITY_DN7244_c0_g2~~TRINITY_DN7244_c0_g2_i2.p1  ORF type:complete len:1456 (-),score=302.42 TRINITY_DN7244_c0_g2_i2:180-4547(-)
MPRWDFSKFTHVDRTLGTSMKSVGEVMAIGRTFEEAIQKTIRMVNCGSVNGFESGRLEATDELLVNASSNRILIIAEALAKGYQIERICKLTSIDKWFIYKLKNITDFERVLKTLTSTETLSAELMRSAKKLGFSDKQIARCLGTTELVIRSLRHSQKILPVVKQIDTVSAEFPASNNYLYMTYNGTSDDVPQKNVDEGGKSIIVLGSGGYSIGSSVEFDWCAVSCIRTIGQISSYERIVINCNPETVSTDYDECEKLYFEEISFETVTDIYEREFPRGVIVSMGGQVAQNIALMLASQSVKILGTSPESIDSAENRYKFSRMLDKLGVDQPKWKECKTLEDTKKFCRVVGYPCLVRPSFVLSGAGMTVVNTDAELETYLKESVDPEKQVTIVISKFITEAKEIDVDAVAQDGNVILIAISEHIENAGVHSGDATLVYPAQDLDEATVKAVTKVTQQIAEQLDANGPFNIQFIAKNNEIKVIECNLRSSRSFPFVSKASGINFSEIAARVLLGDQTISPIHIDCTSIHKVAVKVPQFSFARLAGADPVLGVEMASTGEVACFASNKYEAYIKGLCSTGFKVPSVGSKVLISIGSFKEKQEFLPSAKKLEEMGYHILGTPGTADFLSESGVKTVTLEWSTSLTPSTQSSNRRNNSSDDQIFNEFDLQEHLSTNQISLCILLPSKNRYRRPSSFMSQGYLTRRMAVDYDVPLITNIKCAKTFVDALRVVPRDLPVTQLDCLSSRQLLHMPGLVDTSMYTITTGLWTKISKSALTRGCTAILVKSHFGSHSGVSITPSALHKECELIQAEAVVDACCSFGILLSADHLPPFDKQVATTICGLSFDSHQAFENWLDNDFECNNSNDVKEENEELGSPLELNDVINTNWKDYASTHSLPICVPASTRSNVAALLMFSVLHNLHVHVTDVSDVRDLELIVRSKKKEVKVTCQVHVSNLLDKKKDLLRFIDSIDVIDIGTKQSKNATVEVFKDGETLSFLLNAINSNLLTPEQLVEKLHKNPCQIFKLQEQLESFLEVDMARHWTIVDPASPLCGTQGVGSIYRLLLQGHVAFIDGKVTQEVGLPDVVNLVLPHEHAFKHIEVPSISAYSSKTSLVKPTSLPTKHQVLPKDSFSLDKSSTEIPHHIQPVISSPSITTNHILSVKQFDRNKLHSIFSVAHDMKLMVQRVGRLELLKNAVMATVFLEPSTRTRCSFEAAMLRLGGVVINVSQDTSSLKKGESLDDTIRTVEQYADVIVLRAPHVGSALESSKLIRKPLINAGDGAGEHPTQAILDTFTIRQELGTLNGIIVTFVGDLKYGRTVHSLVQMLTLYDVTFNYVSPEDLKLPRPVFEFVASQGIVQHEYTDHNGFEEVFSLSDVVYVTRLQKERFDDISVFERVCGMFKVTPHLMSKAKSRMCLLHPLPRVDEISPLVDSDPRAAYFRQMENGMYIRMALLVILLGKV